MEIVIDRMDLDDVGGDPLKLAKAVIDQLPDLKPPVPVREIAAALDIYDIREEVLEKLEGCLITPADKSEGAILVRSDRPETRKRFTIGHELGHYLNPWHKPPSDKGFRCSAKDMAAERFAPKDRAVQMEVEANLFASALLMPPHLFKLAQRKMSGVDIDHILTLSDRFEVSREAAAHRYVDEADEPLAMVFSKDGIIRYVKPSRDFPRIRFRKYDPLPTDSLAAKSTKPIGIVTDWDAIEGEEWLKEGRHGRICEQTLAQQNGFRMTLLALDEPEPEEDETDEANWKPPSFRR